MHTIAFLNKKGGVGKSSSTCHLGGVFGRFGRRVLLVDNDPQASLSQGFFGPQAVDGFGPEETIAAIYEGHRPYPSEVIRRTSFEGIDLVPGSNRADDFNVSGPESLDAERRLCLREFLEVVAGEGAYDLCLIDCPPNLQLCSYAALAASHWVIVPTQPEEYGSQGLPHVVDLVDLVRDTCNPGLEILGILLTMVRRIDIHEVTEAKIRGHYGDRVFENVVRDAAAYKEAITFRSPITMYKPRSAAAAQVGNLALEILGRIAARSAPVLAAEEVA